MSERLLELAKRKYLDSQKIYRYLSTDKFTDAYKVANDTQKATIEKLINSGQLRELRSLCEVIIPREIEEKTVMQLRDIAKKIGIINYQSGSKAYLLSELKRRGHDPFGVT